MSDEESGENTRTSKNVVELSQQYEKYLATTNDRLRFRAIVVSRLSIGAQRLADAAWVVKDDEGDPTSEFLKYRTRVRHYINDRHDLKVPTDRAMLWAYACKNAPQAVEEFIQNTPLTVLADEFTRIVLRAPPTSDEYSQVCGTYQDSVDPDIWMEISGVKGRNYFQVHAVNLRKQPFRFCSTWTSFEISGVFLNFGVSASSTIMILRGSRDAELDYFYPHFIRENGPEGVDAVDLMKREFYVPHVPEWDKDPRRFTLINPEPGSELSLEVARKDEREHSFPRPFIVRFRKAVAFEARSVFDRLRW